MNGPTNHDPTAEAATLAACMMTKPARDRARRQVVSADFYDIRHQRIWDAMSELDRTQEGVDPSSLRIMLQAQHPTSAELLPGLLTWPAVPEHVETYAKTVREWAVRRRVYSEAVVAQQKALNPEIDALTLASSTATAFTRIRDTGDTEDAAALTMAEVLAGVDVERDWLVHGLLERRDRLMLTGEEGLGKSHLMRQLAVMAAAGLDPFDSSIRVPPISVLIVDCENSLPQIRRAIRPVVGFAAKYGYQLPRLNVLPTPRMDITGDRDLARLHREMDACQPDLVVIGPLYRLFPRALNTDDEAAPVLAALDTLRDRGAALIIEAHAGHGEGKGKVRDLRPRGSSALMGWPEFGYGMRARADGGADLVPWRGDRDSRAWPTQLRHDNAGVRWIPNYTPDNPIPQDAWGA